MSNNENVEPSKQGEEEEAEIPSVPQVKLFKDREMTEEIPFLGYPDRAIEMGTTGSVVGYILNTEMFPYVIQEFWHDDKNATPIFESEVLQPHVPVRVTLKWTPPSTDDKTKWKPLKGGIHIKGMYVIE